MILWYPPADTSTSNPFIQMKTLTLFFSFLQDEKNQLMQVSLWIRQVRYMQETNLSVLFCFFSLLSSCFFLMLCHGYVYMLHQLMNLFLRPGSIHSWRGILHILRASTKSISTQTKFGYQIFISIISTRVYFVFVFMLILYLFWMVYVLFFSFWKNESKVQFKSRLQYIFTVDGAIYTLFTP